jgi:hypothetical protein
MATNDGNADVWHWKGARTNAIGLSDDKWWSTSGRGSDDKTIGAYNENINSVGDGPMYSGPITNGHFIIVPVGGSTGDLETDILHIIPVPNFRQQHLIIPVVVMLRKA